MKNYKDIYPNPKISKKYYAFKQIPMTTDIGMNNAVSSVTFHTTEALTKTGKTITVSWYQTLISSRSAEIGGIKEHLNELALAGMTKERIGIKGYKGRFTLVNIADLYKKAEII